MKRFTSILFLLLLVFAVCSAQELEKQTIIITYVVPPVQPQFMIRNVQTGEAGRSVIYSTDSIADNDVSTVFQIVQSNDCNWIGDFEVSICATELTAVVGGKTYGTHGVDIIMDGVSFGSMACLNLSYCGYRQSSQLGSFTVTWPTSDGLAKGTYQAVISLNCTAL